MTSLISHSPLDTERVGETWGREASAGMVIALSGDLGAGKTQLVRGFARGLGITARVHSPTFTLLNVYGGGRLPLFHLDLYRLETPDQILSAGLDEYWSPKGVAVIEWAERWPVSQLPGTSSPPGGAAALLRRVTIEVLNDTQRRITYEDSRA